MTLPSPRLLMRLAIYLMALNMLGLVIVGSWLLYLYTRTIP